MSEETYVHNILEDPKTPEDIRKRAQALRYFLNDRPIDTSWPSADIAIIDYTNGLYGGILFSLEDNSEFLVCTDSEADVVLEEEIVDYWENAPESIQVDNLACLSIEDRDKAERLQQQGKYDDLRNLLGAHIEGIKAQEKQQGRGYMISDEDGKEYAHGDYFIYRMQ